MSAPATYHGATLRHTWTYRDSAGKEIGSVARYDHPDGRKEVVPYFRRDGRTWTAGGPPEPRPLFGLEVLGSADPSRAVLVGEGEKVAGALQSLGLVAVTSQGGAKAAGKSDWSVLSGRPKVYLLPDNDRPGEDYARDMTRALAALEQPPEVQIVRLPGLPEAGDVVDWIQARLPGWDGFAPVPETERDRLRAELLETVKTHAIPPPAEWLETGEPWPMPEPLTATVAPEPYPLDALPAGILAAVSEVQRFVQAPTEMVATSALSAVSLAAQAYADVRRAERLTGPVGLYSLVIADSGERKSSTDGYFTSAIRQYEQEQTELNKPVQAAYRAEAAAWDAKRAGVLEAIKAKAKKSESTAEHDRALETLEAQRPEPPRVPRLTYGDATPEALTYALAKQWPSGGVLSSEAGAVFGSHGMKGDSIMRNLAALNVLWDGTPLTFDRRKEDGSYTVRGARLTVGLQVQEPTLREFFDRSGPLARGTGFLARFLVCWPQSTQGTRAFREPPASWPALSAFHRRIAGILAEPPTIEDGALQPVMLDLSPAAKGAWVRFHDAVEAELRAGGELYDVRDVASKTADNAARLAALFHVYEHGASEQIGPEHMGAACLLAAWHLHEARRFFGELAMPPEMVDAARLDGWLLDHCRRERVGAVRTKAILQYGPPGLRDAGTITAAAAVLQDLGRVRMVRDGKRKTIEVNPALLAGGVA